MRKRFWIHKLAVLGLIAALAWSPASPGTAAQAAVLPPRASAAEGHAVSPPLRSLPGEHPAPGGTPRTMRRPGSPLLTAQPGAGSPAAQVDPVLQSASPSLMPSLLASFDGQGNRSNVLPPDPEGSIGYDPATGKRYYVQWVNLSLEVWDVTGTPQVVAGPVSGGQIFSPLAAPTRLCATGGQGDPIVLFDSLAGRWVLSQFAFSLDSSNNPLAPFYQCIAVSQTGDPAGSYNLYAFLWGNTLNDYAKLGVWSDGYYLSSNQFNGNTFVGVGVAAFERSRMLTGAASPQMVYFNVGKTSQIYASLLPADLDGTTPPPAGAAEIFGEIDPGSTFNLWNFHVDWGSPAKSTFGQSLQPDQSLPVASYRQLPCVTASTPTTSCIPQPGSAPRLDGVADRLMNRLAFRSYGDHQSLAAVHTVWADGTDRAGLRWYELRSTGSGWSIYQQGTFAPADGLYRWMGSAAMDGQGDLAVGYSVSGASLYPSIRYAGRLAGDPLGSLAQGEARMTAGGGAQLSSSGRWGDYSDLTVDPRDGCTFWYTQEYYPSSSNDGWQTRIASFRFTACTPVGLPLGPKLVFLPLIDR